MTYEGYKEAVKKEVISRFPYLVNRPEELNEYLNESVIIGDYNGKKEWNGNSKERWSNSVKLTASNLD